MRTIPCPHCGKPLNVASLLGALGAGKPKKFSKAEIRRRTARLAEARATKAAKRRPSAALIKDDDPRPALGEWAPGGYLRRCRRCASMFAGDKRATECADCAYGSSPGQLPKGAEKE